MLRVPGGLHFIYQCRQDKYKVWLKETFPDINIITTLQRILLMCFFANCSLRTSTIVFISPCVRVCVCVSLPEENVEGVLEFIAVVEQLHHPLLLQLVLITIPEVQLDVIYELVHIRQRQDLLKTHLRRRKTKRQWVGDRRHVARCEADVKRLLNDFDCLIDGHKYKQLRTV